MIELDSKYHPAQEEVPLRIFLQEENKVILQEEKKIKIQSNLQEEDQSEDMLLGHHRDLTYVGQGEWVLLDSSTGQEAADTLKGDSSSIGWDPEWIHKWRCTIDKDLQLHERVIREGYPNRWGAQVPIETRWNLDRLQELLHNYEDQEVVEWIRYGWPMGRLPTLADPAITHKNHKGATDYPQAMKNYIDKELKRGAVMGPYDKTPFTGKVGISPLSSRPKKDSEERRIILDLSFPCGMAVNNGIPKDNYMGWQAKLTFPKVDDFAFRIYSLGRDCVMFKVDLSRYFRQLPMDPGDHSLIGYIIDGQIYFDKVLPMGMRSAPYIAQRVTNAIAYIHRQMHYFLLNYVDDFVGAEMKQHIWQAYQALTGLLEDLRVEVSKEKLVPPTNRLEFLGITFDSTSMTMEISQEKMAEIMQELNCWLTRTQAMRHEVESLIGKLQFLAKCIGAGRIFLSRLIEWIRGMNRKDSYSIPAEARKDIAWWGRCAMAHNGISLIWLHKEPEPDSIIATDACLVGFEGTKGNQYFRGKFPKHLENSNIAYLEILAVMSALKVWGESLTGLYFWVHVDNEAVASVLNTGGCRNIELQNVLREIALIAAKHQFVIKARHISGISNRVPDWLSRWHQGAACREFRNYSKDKGLKHIRVRQTILHMDNEW